MLKKRITEAKLPAPKRNALIREFIAFAVKELGLKAPYNCKILLTDDANKTETYAHFNPSNNDIVVYRGDRLMSDLKRSLCHELCHYKQARNGELKANSGKTGSEHENEANSVAGIIMRKWGRLHPESYEK